MVSSPQAANSSPGIPEIQPDPSSPSGDVAVEVYNKRGIPVSEQLASLGFLCAVPNNFYEDQATASDLDTDSDSYCVDSELLENFDSFWSFATFARSILQRHLVSAVSLMNVVHVRCVDMMITTAYSMARDVLCTPTKLKFAREKEDELYKSLMEMTVMKQDEIKQLIAETITSCNDSLVEKAAEYQFKDVTVPESGEITSIKDLKLCTSQIQDLVLLNLNKAIAGRLVGSVDVLRESYTGVLTRCLAALEQMDDGAEQPTKTSIALRDILNAAYHVEIPLGASASFMKTLIEKMKQLMHVVLWRPPPCVNGEWKRKIATNMLATVSDARCQRLVLLSVESAVSFMVQVIHILWALIERSMRKGFLPQQLGRDFKS